MGDPSGKGMGLGGEGDWVMGGTPYASPGVHSDPTSLTQEMDFLSAGNPCDGFK